jgi:CRP-like cAMP-binding protein
MSVKSIQDCIKEHVQVDDKNLGLIDDSFEYKKLEKNDFLIKEGRICSEMAFIHSGYLRMFNSIDGKEITLWIGSPDSFITSLSSFVFQVPSQWNIQSIGSSQISIITKERHLSLCREVSEWLEFDNLLLARSFTLLEKRMFGHLYQTAEERFDNLFTQNPEIFNHVPLQNIASWLGITPETLSRIRKSKLGNS